MSEEIARIEAEIAKHEAEIVKADAELAESNKWPHPGRSHELQLERGRRLRPILSRRGWAATKRDDLRRELAEVLRRREGKARGDGIELGRVRGR